MKVRMAKKNAIAGVRTFFVPSRTEEGVEHIVVEIKRDGRTSYYCNCNDYFYRKLPFISTNLWSGCDHVDAVKAAIEGKAA
ncbi:MAG: hypothetical protein HRJ53_00790 [Acidobacteria bacterium Pan2503]|uniref:SWIM-type domain-containing protein n=1 Tax=Candidatus Acidiferrum panamense TaxID=2741543 RepID=A0A7V8NLI4_9BACT|nr:hypothetical protein [Candidatus Acidoferrum panamensis]